MTAIALSEHQLDRAYQVAAEIGAAIRSTRRGRGETAESLAVACDTHATTVRNLERGASPNPKLGNVLKVLAHLGLTLAVVRDEPPMVSRGTYEKTHNGSLINAVPAVLCESQNFAGESL